MYASYFGLKQAPFSIAPDPRYLFMSERHREALAHLLYGVGGGGGFVLLTGEIGACQYGDKEGTIGVTLCYPPGEGAKGQPPSTYALVASRHEREGGVFRVDVRTGVMSICYVLKAEVVCTPPAK